MSTDIHARLGFTRIAPRKMRLVAKSLPNLSVADAEARLKYLAPRSSQILLKLLRSAVANAKHNFNLDPKDLIVRDVIVEQGVTLKRYRPRARGAAYRVEKKTSHVDMVLAERTPSGKPRKGKKSEIVTRKVEELSAEELSGEKERGTSPGGKGKSRAVRPAEQAKSTRQLFHRRGGEA